jgi:hypothetical protein
MGRYFLEMLQDLKEAIVQRFQKSVVWFKEQQLINQCHIFVETHSSSVDTLSAISRPSYHICTVLHHGRYVLDLSLSLFRSHRSLPFRQLIFIENHKLF